MTRLLQRLITSFVLLLSPATVFALGLGEIDLHSGLNEPLSADIELVSAAPDELSSLRASLASRETFARYGLERSASFSDLQFRVGRSADGRNVLQVRSREAITEPFLSFLVEVNWSRGRLLREYTLLLDPPVYMPGEEQARSAPVTAPQAGATESARSGAVQRPVEPEPRATEPRATEPTSVSRPSQPVAIDGSSYTVRNNDTLWNIANNLKPGASSEINRTMLTLYRANPEAFGGNINQLRAGAILRIPADAEFGTIGTGEANAEVRRQYAEWRASRGLAGEGAALADARLRLVTPEQGGEGAAPSTTTGAESQALRDRVAQLESQLEESRRAIELRDRELAQLQQQLGQQPAMPAPAPETTAEPEPTTAEPEPTTAAPTDVTEAPVEEPAPSLEPEAAQPEPTPEPAPAEEPAQPTWIDWLLENWYYPLAALLILGGIIFGLTRRRQEPDFGSFGKLAEAARVPVREPKFERESVTSPMRATNKAVDDTFLVEESGERPQPKFAPAAVEPVRAEKKPKSEPSRRKADDTLSSETAINLDQGDPLAEADFHMAYGLYDQAADLVRIATEREPQRRDLKLKLLEIFFVWGNKDAFLQAARQLADTRGEAPAGEWEKISIMGRQISPDDPLFAGGGRPGAAAADVDLNLEGGENRVDLDLLGPADGEAGGGIDLDLGHAGDDDASDTGEVAELREGEVGLDFVLDSSGQHSDGSATTREMTARTMETPTIETEMYGDASEVPTVETPAVQRDSTTIREKLSAAMLNRDAMSPDQTAELALDDLGLEVDQLPDAEGGSLSDFEETDHPGDAATLVAGLDERSRRAIENAEAHARGRDADRTMRSRTLTGEEKISPTGTWVLDDKTLAATVALPGGGRGDSSTTQDRMRALAAASGASESVDETARRRKLDSDSTAELAGLAGEEMDLDLDRLESALKSDTVKQQRKGASAEDRFASDVFGSKDAADGLDLDVGEVRRDRDRAPTGTARIPVDEMGLPELEPVTMSEVGTKLDLARAYMDMGDPEGARSILEEVLQEGSANQKQEAQRLIDSLPG